MASTTRIDPDGLNCFHQICRLCLSEESVDDVFKEQGLQQWISDFLSITISITDCMSKVICTVCRVRLTEFHRFRIRCQDVQKVLQAKTRGGNLDESESEDMVGIEDMIEIGEVKIETRTDDDEVESSNVLSEVQFSTLSKNDVNKTSSKSITSSSNNPNCQDWVVGYSNRENLTVHKLTKQHLPKLKGKIDNTDITMQNKTDNDTASSESSTNLRQIDKIDSNDSAKLSCSKCNKTFNRQTKMKKHMKTHDLKIREQHSNGTEDESPTRCNICQKLFSSESKLIKHNRYHRSDRYVCPVCDKPCADGYRLQRHIPMCKKRNGERKKTDDGSKTIRPFKCDVCQKPFKLEKTLRGHKLQVHGPKIHGCHLCDLKFKTRAHLARHVSRHSRGTEKEVSVKQGM